jgi:hypothetical protein
VRTRSAVWLLLLLLVVLSGCGGDSGENGDLRLCDMMFTGADPGSIRDAASEASDPDIQALASLGGPRGGGITPEIALAARHKCLALRDAGG